MSVTAAQTLGDFLRSRRTRLDPASFGFAGRRRTPGLRREEVAQRANISSTWYTWLEQGRGGAPSAEVLERICAALMLTDIEREHLFMLGLGRPPEVRYRSVDGVNPRLQRVLDSLDASPSIIKTATWDVVAWNRAAAVVLTDYSMLPAGQRNILRFLFSDPAVRAKQREWESVARFVVGAFRADVARAGLASEVGDLVDDLCRASPDFDRMWRDNQVLGHSGGENVKRLLHPRLGPVELEYSLFAVDGRPDLGMIVYTPLDAQTAERIRAAVAQY
ncbi:helix-turn-helix transcriptional regulator [Paraburkholderia caballeronis]|uniref:Helix-turn-helix domain-containing protein n=1 Tax=Paraburkholderia caballeronis TaxID=416943 RepID=A0A1H7I0M8_9BURK|nr:helix-turn-helix transcriptional regulator [Paraburkholderia caballeronis]PXW29300.1 helix-turn-helix protein [Paraburkholderia caballeronis]PXX04559.1 helix-turn-helix protein [Paraburkholderia caballeronis]RAK05620.1 helix-turn-helix protein [Paraburkholderia caballeronis]SEC95953.1 Helix-turn-helix domain-containing protein [Paraburkholderia caballeronis]SEK55422.1 Helix-turn-helix domain-containing protein [Paraburkholderia caballeronis]